MAESKVKNQCVITAEIILRAAQRSGGQDQLGKRKGRAKLKEHSQSVLNERRLTSICVC